jgi:DNA processing protein
MTVSTAQEVLDTGNRRRYQPPGTIEKTSLGAILRARPRFSLSKNCEPTPDLFGAKPGHADTEFWYTGNVELLTRPCVAVVGSRKVSLEGAARARRLARELVRNGIVVVSGLAFGVDTEAHTAAISAGGRTIAVLGTPLDKCSPSQNSVLQEEIYTRHLLVSQFRVGTSVFQSNFPVRNRLMAALTDATVIIEATDASGTLHQAAECAKRGRWLFITKSVVDDQNVKWPREFLRSPNCVCLESITDITSRILK